MRLISKILLLLAAAAAFAAPLEGALRAQAAKPEDADTGAHGHGSVAAPHSFVPPGASWEALFNASWR
jgi:hypothetical protein